MEQAPDLITLILLFVGSDLLKLIITSGKIRSYNVDLLFEGMIKNKFYISFPGEGNWAISFEPAMNVRMLMEHSFPVINPSYHAVGDILYRLPTSKESMSFINLRIGHHSNGQADLFWNYILCTL